MKENMDKVKVEAEEVEEADDSCKLGNKSKPKKQVTKTKGRNKKYTKSTRRSSRANQNNDEDDDCDDYNDNDNMSFEVENVASKKKPKCS